VEVKYDEVKDVISIRRSIYIGGHERDARTFEALVEFVSLVASWR